MNCCLGVKIKMKKNPLFDKLYEDEMMTKDISHLPEHFRLAIKHERKCIQHRAKQIEIYLLRIALMTVGKDYYDTFENIPASQGIGFPKEEYMKLRKKWDKEQEKKKKKSPYTNTGG